MADHYAVLGISRTATKAQVKDAYRRNARRLHPDVNPDPWAAERFTTMTHAYEVLSDDTRRAEYDLTLPAISGVPQDGPDHVVDVRHRPDNPQTGFDDEHFVAMAKTVVDGL